MLPPERRPTCCVWRAPHGNAAARVDAGLRPVEYPPMPLWASLPAAGARAAHVTLLLALLSIARHSAAEPRTEDKALATVLFQEGRARMAEGRVPEACSKFEESQRLDPSGGTLLNLALCHEKDARLAQAWSEFGEAIAEARRDQRPDREAAAKEHVLELEPRLSRLTVLVPEAARIVGLRIELDGRELAEASWSLAIPIDGAEHAIRATAPGRAPLIITAHLGGEARATTVEITPLALLPVSPPEAPPARAPVPTSATPPAVASAPTERGFQRTLGWAVGAAGVAQLAVAGYCGARAFSLHANGRDADAGQLADASTVLSLTGLATTAAGVYLLLTSSKAPAQSNGASGAVHVALVGGTRVEISGSF